MEPTAFEVDQTNKLPPHELLTLARDQPQYRPLPVAILHGPEGRAISRWSFSAEERVAIAAGEDLYLEQLTFRHPFQPILPTVGLRDFCPATI